MAHRLDGWKQKLKQRFASNSSREKEVNRAGLLPLYTPKEWENIEKLDPDWINLKALRTWLHDCDTRHGDQCKPSNIALVLPRWLIDVQRLCLVEAKPGARYISLSYVWGQVPCARTLRSNLEQMQQPGSISDTNGRLLNPTYHTRRYSTHRAPGRKLIDANHGLRGIKGVTETRMLGPNGNQDILESLQPYSTIWYSRGWTFQELIFSPRKIMFQYQMAIWECSCGVWHEATPMKDYLGLDPYSRTGGYFYTDDGLIQNGRPLPGFVSCTPFEIKPNLEWPDMQQYMNLVRSYNDRQLTYPEDVIAGFSGVLSVLSRVFDGGFIWGLPEMFLDHALLWQPASPLMRRTPSAESSNVSLPSWSWAGWRGDIDPNSWESGRLLMVENAYTSTERKVTMFDYEVKPVCEWSIGTGKTWRKLNIGHYQRLENRDQYILSSKEIPEGWRLNSFPDRLRNSFRHDSMPGAFYYPVVLGAVGQPGINDLGHLLSCRTRKLYLYMGGQYDQADLVCEQRNLITESGLVCGDMILNRSPDYVIETSSDSLFRMPCELIVISEGVLDDLWSEVSWKSIFTSPSNPNVGEFYNVLWIDRVDGIAYRRALGRVAKHVWESYPEEWIDVVLG